MEITVKHHIDLSDRTVLLIERLILALDRAAVRPVPTVPPALLPQPRAPQTAPVPPAPPVPTDPIIPPPVAPAIKPAPPAASSTSIGSVWTPERLARLQTLWESGCMPFDIMGEMNVLPGIPITTEKAILSRVHKSAFKRKTEKTEPATKPASSDTIKANWTTILRWAQGQRIDTASGTDDEVFERINKHRISLGLPLYAETDI